MEKFPHAPDGWVACILNCHANSQAAQNLERELKVLLSGQSREARLILTHDGAEISVLAKKALSEGASILVAAGGDGSVNAVASEVIGSDAVLGVLPLGTLNHFSKDNGIPLDLKAAVENLFTGVIRAVDVGEVNGRIFLNNSSIGMYPEIVQERENAQAGGARKWHAFAQAVLYVLRSYSKLHVVIKPQDGAPIEEKTPFVFVGNNRYELSGTRVGQRARMDAGKLWVHGAPNAGRARLFWLAARALLGWHDPRAWHNFEAEAFSINLRRHRVRVSFDGEVEIMQSPLRYRVLPKALKVMVPVPENVP